MAEGEEDSDATFLSHMVPKQPTQASEFLKAYPTYDGRNVIIGILDTGVDPSAAGLQLTSDGKPKILDIRDCTGDGRVQLTSISSAKPFSLHQSAGESIDDARYVLNGVRGFPLIVSKEIVDSCPSNQFFIGEKDMFSMFPSKVSKQIFEVIKRKNEAFGKICLSSVDNMSIDHPFSKEEINSRRNIIKDNDYYEAGMRSSFVVNIVVFRDASNVWRMMIDKLGNGDLSFAKPLASYRIDQQFDHWSDEIRLCYSADIEYIGEPGSVDLSKMMVSIVTDCSSHGTHVASIAAGFHPDNPDLNGIAPGAQIISLKIGDARLDGMETSKSIVNAVSLAVRLGCDIVNMSFGETTHSSAAVNSAVMQCVADAIRRHGLLFVTSAGNSGPSLSTVGAPGNLANAAILTIGAYIDNDMRAKQYNSLKIFNSRDMNDGDYAVPEGIYDWSSRGPTYAGNLGVDVIAPGGAVASVAGWTQKRQQQMNGTSMASPNAAGNVALLVSAMKQREMRYSNVRIKRVIENSARFLPDVDAFGQGCGLIQVMQAFKLAQKEATLPMETCFHLDMPFAAAFSTPKGFNSDNPAGIYPRNTSDPKIITVHEVKIDPNWTFEEDFHVNNDGYAFSYSFPSDHAVHSREEYIINRWPKKFMNLLQVHMKLSANVDWIKLPDEIIYHGDEDFKVLVDPRKLPPGAHFTWVTVSDEKINNLLEIDQYPLLRIPVTIIVPENIHYVKKNLIVDVDYESKEIEFRAGKIQRIFLQVPVGALNVDIRVQNNDRALLTDDNEQDLDEEGIKKLFYVECFQMMPEGSYRYEKQTNYHFLTTENKAEIALSSQVAFPGIVEVCICQSWRYRGKGLLKLQIKFQGLELSSSDLSFSPSNEYTEKVRISTTIRETNVTPALSFKSIGRLIYPDPNVAPLYLEEPDKIYLPFDYPEKAAIRSTGSNPRKNNHNPGQATMKRLYSRFSKSNNISNGDIDASLLKPIVVSPSNKVVFSVIIEYAIDDCPGSASFGMNFAHELLYDSPFFCHMMYLLDKDRPNKVVRVIDSFGEEKTGNVPAGNYRLKLCLSHTNKDFLRKFVKSPITMTIKNPIHARIQLFWSLQRLVMGNNSMDFGVLSKNVTREVYIKLEAKDISLPPWIKSGDVISGELSMYQNQGVRAAMLGKINAKLIVQDTLLNARQLINGKSRSTNNNSPATMDLMAALFGDSFGISIPNLSLNTSSNPALSNISLPALEKKVEDAIADLINPSKTQSEAAAVLNGFNSSGGFDEFNNINNPGIKLLVSRLKAKLRKAELIRANMDMKFLGASNPVLLAVQQDMCSKSLEEYLPKVGSPSEFPNEAADVVVSSYYLQIRDMLNSSAKLEDVERIIIQMCSFANIPEASDFISLASAFKSASEKNFGQAIKSLRGFKSQDSKLIQFFMTRQEMYEFECHLLRDLQYWHWEHAKWNEYRTNFPLTVPTF